MGEHFRARIQILYNDGEFMHVKDKKHAPFFEDKKKVGRVARHTRRELRSNLLRSCLKVQVVFNQLCQNKENKSER